jgi:methyl-accepting chemotaxis protein/methyl-accepting chemotaxis protein-1 (serine sensor receptor)
MFMTMALGLVSLLGLSSADKSLAAVADDSLARVSQSSRVESSLLQMRGDMWRHLGSADPSDRAVQDQDIQRQKDLVKTELAAMQASTYSEEEKELVRKLQPLLDQFYRAWDDAAELSRASKDEDAAKKFIEEGGSPYKAARELAAANTESNRSSGVRNSADAHSQSSHTQTLVWVVLIVAILAGCGLLFAMVRSINTGLAQAVSEVGSGAAQVASAASQIAASSQALAQGSSEQAASLEETSSSSEEINSMARKNTENTRTAVELMGRLQTEFTAANNSLDGTVAAMDELNTASQKISKIIKVIDEIAFQTNILALNAAVEAARAGEAGAGFAVVADEVRNLAQRSAQAAKDTSTLIAESITRSRDSKEKVDHVAAAIRSIAQDSNKIQVLVDEVNVASQEQSRGIEQVARAVTQMESLTQRSAASAEESASASTELTAQASTLKDIVQRLSEMVGGHAEGGSAAHDFVPAGPRRQAPAVAYKKESRKEFPLNDGESDF